MAKTLAFKTPYGTYDILFSIGRYQVYNNTAVEMYSKAEDGDYYEPFASMTVNINDLPDGCACIDTNNIEGIESFIEENGLGKNTGLSVRSGFCVYPIYQFDLDKFADHLIAESEV